MELENKRNDLLFQARMNIYYHESQESRCLNVLNWTAFVSVILSSVAFSAVFDLFPAYPEAKPIAIVVTTFIVAVLNSVILAFGVLNKFTIHSGLKRKWIEFSDRCESNEEIENLNRMFHELNAEEPAPNKRLLEQSYGRAQKSLGWKTVQ